MSLQALRLDAPWKLLPAGLAWALALAGNRPFWDALLWRGLRLDPGVRWAEALHFFLYDTAKILLLLVGIVYAVALVRSYFSVERTQALLGGRREGVGNALAAALGVVTPFCSCSAVPAFIGFVAAGVPLGVTLSFLIASPMVNEVALVLLFGLFGWKVAALYLGAGLLVAVVGGWVLGRLGLERWVEAFVYQIPLGERHATGRGPDLVERMGFAAEEVRTIVGKVWPYLVAGIALGAVVHGWVPEGFFLRVAGPENPFAVFAAVLLGIPLYSSAAGVLPLVEALHAKGLAMGTLLAFMMAVVALSLPEMLILRRVLKLQLIAVYVAVVAAGIVGVGYLFNAVLG
ncbi:permease [Oceanithermus sp.]|uniref:permease n=1 Tax=Oceanithermus sp. TaxID=2268145 RepID=UPI0025800CD6|nr:permease [Oceanithermus sp.]